MAKRDYYEILGVDRSDDQNTIKKAYRKLAMKYHPDKNPDDKVAEDKFKEAAEAYEVLGNEQKKAQYDRFGHAGVNNQGMGAGGFHDASEIFDHFSDIFGDFFGGGGGFSSAGGRRGSSQPRPRRGADLRYRIQVNLKEAYEGKKTTIQYKSEEDCLHCDGKGIEPGKTAHTCSTCGGSGQVVQSQGFFRMATTCHTCGGAGQIIKDPCTRCHGQKRIEKPRKLEVTIPAGIEDGNQLRLTSEGDGGHLGGGKGDLYVLVNVVPDSKFRREGNDLVSDLEISYLQSILGAEFTTESINSKVDIEIPAGTQNADEVVVKRKGFDSLKGRSKGDLRFKIKVVMPKSPSKNEIKLLKEIAKEKGENIKEKSGWFS